MKTIKNLLLIIALLIFIIASLILLPDVLKHRLNDSTLTMDIVTEKEKGAIIENMTTTAPEVESIMGMTNIYRRIVKQ